MPTPSRNISPKNKNLPANSTGPNTPSNHPEMKGNGPWVFIIAIVLVMLPVYINQPSRTSNKLTFGFFKLESEVEWKK